MQALGACYSGSERSSAANSTPTSSMSQRSRTSAVRATAWLAVLLSAGALVHRPASAAKAPSANDVAAARKVRLEHQRSGFNWMSALQWKNMDKTNNTKPYMFTFLSSHCYLCVGLLEHFATKESPTWLSSISSQFNAVLIYDSLGWEHVSPMYTPSDVSYVPRTIFAWPNGTMRNDLISHNARGEDDKFYYLPRELLYQMWSILKVHYRTTEPHISDLEDDLAS